MLFGFLFLQRCESHCSQHNFALSQSTTLPIMTQPSQIFFLLYCFFSRIVIVRINQTNFIDLGSSQTAPTFLTIHEHGRVEECSVGNGSTRELWGTGIATLRRVTPWRCPPIARWQSLLDISISKSISASSYGIFSLIITFIRHHNGQQMQLNY